MEFWIHFEFTIVSFQLQLIKWAFPWRTFPSFNICIFNSDLRSFSFLAQRFHLKLFPSFIDVRNYWTTCRFPPVLSYYSTVWFGTFEYTWMTSISTTLLGNSSKQWNIIHKIQSDEEIQIITDTLDIQNVVNAIIDEVDLWINNYWK